MEVDEIVSSFVAELQSITESLNPEKMESETLPADMEVDGRGLEAEPLPADLDVDGGGFGLEPAHRQQLLPGFSDEMTFVDIVPKLPWKCFESLASMSSAWLHAVRSREVYDTRVVYRALEPLVLLRYHFNDDYSFDDRLGLFSTRDGFYFDLPLLPICEKGIPCDCQCVTLDGKVYVLGGKHLDFRHVYVLDLAGRRQWKQCASMLRQKRCCGCVALDGKVYVVGYTFRGGPFSEVYDPKTDTWSLTGPMQLERKYFRNSSVRAVGEDLLVISEEFNDDEATKTTEITFTVNNYHRVEDEWRVEKLYLTISLRNDFSPRLFTVQGKLYRMQEGCIYVADMDTKTWMLRHSYSFPGIDEDDLEDVIIVGVITVGDELLALVGLFSEFWLLQSEGFGGKNVNITWHTCNLGPSVCDLGPSHRTRYFRGLYPIEL